MKSLYLLIDLSCIAIPLIASFHPRLAFHKEWSSAWRALSITAALFIVWDYFFTSWGVWGFNERYLLGWEIFGLPLEELLFFICIPYACLFTYFAITKLSLTLPRTNAITRVLAIGLFLIGVATLGRLYTSTTFLLTSGLLSLHLRGLRSTYLPAFYLSYILILVPFFISNGILTGTGIPEEVVWYNNEENLGIRVGTIPIEDSIYALLLILCNVALFESFRGRKLESLDV